MMKTWEEKRQEEIWEAIEQAPELAHALRDELLRQEKEQIRKIMIELFGSIDDIYNMSWPKLKGYINKLLSERGIKGI